MIVPLVFNKETREECAMLTGIFHSNSGDDWTGGGSSSVSVNSASATGFGSTTGSAIVSGGHAWRNLSVEAVGGALVEDGYPMLGRYTSANAVINGTWWTGVRTRDATIPNSRPLVASRSIIALNSLAPTATC